MCEESKHPGDGAGLCPGYTISRAILSDAVCLTRGDRFLTTDLTREDCFACWYLPMLIFISLSCQSHRMGLPRLRP